MTQPVPPTSTRVPPEPVVVEELTPVEAAFYTLVLAALTAWLASVAAKVLRPWRLFRDAPDPMALWSAVPEWTERVAELTRWLGRNAAPVGWDRLNGEQDLDMPYPSTDAHIAAHLAQVGNYLVRIPDEVFNLIMADVVDGHNAGEGFEEIAARIENTLNVTGSENWPARARVIAITEVNGTASAGWFAAALRSEELRGTSLWKEWLNSRDPKVRDEHRGIDRVPLRQPFIVDGFPMMVPGDKTAPAHLVIACRCAPRTVEGPRG